MRDLVFSWATLGILLGLLVSSTAAQDLPGTPFEKSLSAQTPGEDSIKWDKLYSAEPVRLDAVDAPDDELNDDLEPVNDEPAITNASLLNNSGCASCAGDTCGCGAAAGWFDDMLIFIAGDGWGNKADDDDQNNFGFRLGANSSWALGDQPIRAQAGVSYAGYDFYGRDNLPHQRSVETQVFLTGGLYQRSDVDAGEYFSWGAVVDFMYSENWGEDADDIKLSQVRGHVGYAWDDFNEVGLRGSFNLTKDRTRFLGGPGGVNVFAMDQVMAYWKRNWDFGADTTAYVGAAAREPGDILFGLDLHSPLSDYVAVIGNVHYILPSTTGGNVVPNNVQNSFSEQTYNVTIGLAYYPGGRSVSETVSGDPNVPLIPVADNGTFPVSAPVGAL